MLRMTVTACDSNGTRIRQGGASVMVFITTPRGMDILSQATVLDNGDGTYTCEYRSPDNRGSYELHVEVKIGGCSVTRPVDGHLYDSSHFPASLQINGDAACGSPVPVFFSSEPVGAPQPEAEAAQAALPAAAAAAAGGAPGLAELDPLRLADKAREAAERANAALASASSAPNPVLQMTMAIQSRIHASLQESKVVRARDVSALVNEQAVSGPAPRGSFQSEFANLIPAASPPAAVGGAVRHRPDQQGRVQGRGGNAERIHHLWKCRAREQRLGPPG